MVYDRAAHSELGLYIDNDYETYKRKEALKKNYEKKFNKGTYNQQKAQKGVYNLIVVPAARKYDKEFGSRGQSIFDRNIRQSVAKQQTRSIFRMLLGKE
jgi:hypothetical protein